MNETRWSTFEDEGAAERQMVRKNRNRVNETTVLVDGPCDGEFTTMPISDAIAEGFQYIWMASS